MSWHKCYEAILPYVFKVDTPSGSGTGTFLTYNKDKTIFAFATAWHVISHEENWKGPIKLTQETTGKSMYIEDKDRVIFPYASRDSAGILIFKNEFDLPENPLKMMESDKYKKVGNEVGWTGYPGIADGHLCFFSGCISAFVASDDSYFIDGVAIHGVSGGPVFAELADGEPQLLGTISAYRPNRLTGEVLPGMLCAQDVEPLHKLLKTVKSIDEAKERKEEEVSKQENVSVQPRVIEQADK